VQVNPVIVSNSAGDMTAPFFGGVTQRGTIEGFINEIWDQAGIDIGFLSPTTAWIPVLPKRGPNFTPSFSKGTSRLLQVR
jgi:hypothetical protein